MICASLERKKKLIPMTSIPEAIDRYGFTPMAKRRYPKTSVTTNARTE